MKEEIAAAVFFLARLVKRYGCLDNEGRERFAAALTSVLFENYKSHWHPSAPTRGQAYRWVCVSAGDFNAAVHLKHKCYRWTPCGLSIAGYCRNMANPRTTVCTLMFCVWHEVFKGSKLGFLDDRKSPKSAFCTYQMSAYEPGLARGPRPPTGLQEKLGALWRSGSSSGNDGLGGPRRGFLQVSPEHFFKQNCPSSGWVVFAGTGSTVLRFLSRWWMPVVAAMGNFHDASTTLWSGLALRSNQEALRMRTRRVVAQTAAWAPAAHLSVPFPSSKPTLSPKQFQPLATPTVSTGYVVGPQKC